jgi:NADH-quinone oxidoreductase subunit N
MNIPVDFQIVGPGAVVLLGALVALLVDAFYPRRTWLGSAIPSGLAVAIALALAATHRDDLGPLPYALTLIVLVGTLGVVVASNIKNYELAMPPGEYHFLLLSAASGAAMMVVARDLVTLVVSLELLSLASIALVGLRQGDAAAIRAAWKFLIASLMASAVTLMGVSLLYGATGQMGYAQIRAALEEPGVPDQVVAVAVVLTLAGLLFKLGAVPFHAWVPEAYSRASTMVAAFLSTVSKAAALGAVLVLLAVALPYQYGMWQPLIAVVAVASMTVGNIGALKQDDVVGVLAWSSIAQAGFVLAPAVALPGVDGLKAPVQYLAVYAVATLAAFAVLAVMVRLRGATSLAELRGLVRSDPWMGLPLAFVLLVLAGFPPAIIGVVTKYVVVAPVIDEGYTWLAIAMGVNILLGLAVYLRCVFVLLDRPVGEPYVSPSPPVSVRVAKACVLAGAAVLIATSVWPGLLLDHLP